MKVYTVRYSAPREVSDAERAQFERLTLELWRAIVERRTMALGLSWRDAAPHATISPTGVHNATNTD